MYNKSFITFLLCVCIGLISVSARADSDGIKSIPRDRGLPVVVDREERRVG
jgi:hypothetical protein